MIHERTKGKGAERCYVAHDVGLDRLDGGEINNLELFSALVSPNESRLFIGYGGPEQSASAWIESRL